VIDRQLERAGWLDEQIRREVPTPSGPADYVLYDDEAPIAVVEAKRAAKQAELGLDQAARYAGHLGLHFIYAANKSADPGPGPAERCSPRAVLP